MPPSSTRSISLSTRSSAYASTTAAGSMRRWRAIGRRSRWTRSTCRRCSGRRGRTGSLGRPADALPVMERAIAHWGRAPALLGELGTVLAVLGRRDEAHAIIGELSGIERAALRGGVLPVGDLRRVGDGARVPPRVRANGGGAIGDHRVPRRSGVRLAPGMGMVPGSAEAGRRGVIRGSCCCEVTARPSDLHCSSRSGGATVRQPATGRSVQLNKRARNARSVRCRPRHRRRSSDPAMAAAREPDCPVPGTRRRGRRWLGARSPCRRA